MFPANKVLLEPFRNNVTPVLVAGCLSIVHNSMAFIRVLNCQPNSVILKKNLKIASLVFSENVNSVTPFKGPETEGCRDDQEVSKETLDNFIKEYKININDSLTLDDRYKLARLLYNYRDVFTRNLGEMGTYEGFELELRPKNPSLRSYTRQYELNEQDKLEIHSQIEDLKKQNLIEPTTDCSFNSPCFLVRKKKWIESHGRRLATYKLNLETACGCFTENRRSALGVSIFLPPLSRRRTALRVSGQFV